MDILKAVKNNIAQIIVGNDAAIELVMIALVANGHILLEDVPGTGKTSLAKSLARSIDGKFQRLQFTSDTLPGDVIGLEYFDMKESDFKTRMGPVFANIALVDEINRAVPRTQSALLEVMEERTVTISGHTYKLPSPFLVVATQNPLESSGTFPLPDAQLDRFLLTVRQGYPNREHEREMLRRFRLGNPMESLQSVLSCEEILDLQQQAQNILIHEEVENYLLDIVKATREHNLVEIGVSPRGSLAFMRAAQSRALLNGRSYCTPEDFRFLAKPVCSHRLTLTIEGEMKTTKTQVIQEILETVSAPVESV
ncbi:AAA family ATPase [Bacillus wiedmannii]|uniref:AAA family ATPase n=1 Tax=Bacillus TaxID=1386 RepID=UPI00077A88F8|nr:MULTISPECIES: MoxR family ATPase [Bacillus cereus group]KXY80652.1 AAA family ATPase [Bacillus wiedmannii]PEW72956.1 MoxR family ATPase [Bacillus cereus]MDG1622878.1 MoxR family ATPase [Bacillus mobilis]MDX5837490.1 MoxR family ATPase [Bacillus cereus group sp. BfR-BA-01700]MED4383682.1 MoxR family ATPase [Bacillus mobilis]